MPTLGFLKKKRTREHTTSDPSTASQPTSPVTPSSEKTLESTTTASGHTPTHSTVSKSSLPSNLSAQLGHDPTPSYASNSGPGPCVTGQQQSSMDIHNLINPQAQPSDGPVHVPPVQQQYQQQQQGYSTPDGHHLAFPHPPQHQPAQQPPQLQQPQQPHQPQQPQQPQVAGLSAPGIPAPAAQLAAGNHPHCGDQQQQLQTPPSSSHASTQQSTMQAPGLYTPQPVQVPDTAARVTKGKYSLQDFEILRTLGTGSFGRVHLVQSRHNSRFYAVKVLKKAQVVKMKQVEHTNDERRMLGEVKHPFLITLWGTFQDSRNLYMVMDFVEGGELFSLLRKSGRFPNPVAKFYAAEVTLALEYLHSKNIIYRDLKPENLLLDRHGHLKITDFGFAKKVPDKTWTLCGTPDYLAPEVVSNKGYNKSVDWWSLGILIYEMLCGYTPFWDSGSPMKIYENILRGRVKYPPYINPDAQDLLERLITADLTKRLGNLYGGSQDVKNHPWFSEVTWDRLARKDIDAPYTPPVKAGAGDASQFDRYPEETERYGQGGPDEFGYLFGEF